MNNKVIYVDFKKPSRKNKNHVSKQACKPLTKNNSYFYKILNSIKSLLASFTNKNDNKKCIKKYKHWL